MLTQHTTVNSTEKTSWSHRCKASEHFSPASSLSQGMSLSSQTPRLWTLKICCIGSTRNKSESCASQKDIPTAPAKSKHRCHRCFSKSEFLGNVTIEGHPVWIRRRDDRTTVQEKVKITENPKTRVNLVPGSSKYVKCLPFVGSCGWKFTHLEDPVIILQQSESRALSSQHDPITIP